MISQLCSSNIPPIFSIITQPPRFLPAIISGSYAADSESNKSLSAYTIYMGLAATLIHSNWLIICTARGKIWENINMKLAYRFINIFCIETQHDRVIRGSHCTFKVQCDPIITWSHFSKALTIYIMIHNSWLMICAAITRSDKTFACNFIHLQNDLCNIFWIQAQHNCHKRIKLHLEIQCTVRSCYSMLKFFSKHSQYIFWYITLGLWRVQ